MVIHKCRLFNSYLDYFVSWDLGTLHSFDGTVTHYVVCFVPTDINYLLKTLVKLYKFILNQYGPVLYVTLGT